MSQSQRSQPVAEVAAKQQPYSLSAVPELVVVPPRPFIFVRGEGPVPEMFPAAWQKFYSEVSEKIDHKVSMCAGAFMDATKGGSQPDGNNMSYRAGVVVSRLPDDFEYVELPATAVVGTLDGGYFAKFTMKGGYEHLGDAWGNAEAIVKRTAAVEKDNREGFELYLNTPNDLRGFSELATEIYIAIKETKAPWSLSEPVPVRLAPRELLYIEEKGIIPEIAGDLFGRVHGELMPALPGGKASITHCYGAASNVEMTANGPTGVYKVGIVLRKGVVAPSQVADAMQRMSLEGHHIAFTMTGDYDNLGTAWCIAMQRVEGGCPGWEVDASRPCLEKYVAEPMTCPGVTKPLTELLVPVKPKA